MGDFPPHDAPFLADDRPDGEGLRRLGLVLAYLGEGFSGWQVQPKGRTIQGRVEASLSKLCDEPVRVFASGRTDAGVHAWGQVAHFATSSRLSLERMQRGLQSLLPSGVHLRRLGPVSPEFHARFDAKAKTYDYYLWPAAQAGLFMAGRVWVMKRSLDPALVKRALELCLGEKDLRAMACQGWEVKGSTLRRILKTELEVEESGLWRISLTATGFLRHAVRNLVGALSQVGAGRLAPGDLAEMLAAGKRLYAGPKAPPGGLYLSRVFYQEPKI